MYKHRNTGFIGAAVQTLNFNIYVMQVLHTCITVILGLQKQFLRILEKDVSKENWVRWHMILEEQMMDASVWILKM